MEDKQDKGRVANCTTSSQDNPPVVDFALFKRHFDTLYTFMSVLHFTHIVYFLITSTTQSHSFLTFNKNGVADMYDTMRII